MAPVDRLDGVPTTSVVLPTNRAGPFLEEAISSVISQTVADWELLLVDSNCPVDLGDYVVDDRIRVVSSPSRGLSAARNAGVAAARGRYIAFLDDDDLWHPTKLERQLGVLEANAGIGVCHTAVSVIDAVGRVVKPSFGRAVTFQEAMADRGTLASSSLMLRAQVIRSIGGYDVTFGHAQDLDLALRLLRTASVEFLDEVLVSYRMHSNNASREYLTQARGALRALAKQRRQAYAERDWRIWVAGWRGAATVRNGYARNAFARSYRAFRAGLPLSQVLEHLANGFALCPPTIVLSVALFLRSKGSEPWPALDTWEAGIASEAADLPHWRQVAVRILAHRRAD